MKCSVKVQYLITHGADAQVPVFQAVCACAKEKGSGIRDLSAAAAAFSSLPPLHSHPQRSSQTRQDKTRRTHMTGSPMNPSEPIWREKRAHCVVPGERRRATKVAAAEKAVGSAVMLGVSDGSDRQARVKDWEMEEERGRLAPATRACFGVGVVSCRVCW